MSSTANLSQTPAWRIRQASAADVGTVLALIEGLAAYEKLEHVCVATEAQLLATVFAPNSSVHTLLIEEQQTQQTPLQPGKNTENLAPNWHATGFALYFYNYSTFLAKPGIYLEDLFVWPEHRGKGHGKALMLHLARLAVQQGCGRFEWSVLDWNEPSIAFYRSLGAVGMDEWTVQRVSGEALLKLGAPEVAA
jgi:hypothetical protein